MDGNLKQIGPKPVITICISAYTSCLCSKNNSEHGNQTEHELHSTCYGQQIEDKRCGGGFDQFSTPQTLKKSKFLSREVTR